MDDAAKKRLKKILIVGGIVTALTIAYVFLNNSGGTGSEPGLSNSSGTGAFATDINGDVTLAGNRNGEAGQELLTLLASLQTISLDGAIFNDPAFVRLINHSVVLPDVGVVGRENPFLPIGSDAQTEDSFIAVDGQGGIVAPEFSVTTASGEVVTPGSVEEVPEEASRETAPAGS